MNNVATKTLVAASVFAACGLGHAAVMTAPTAPTASSIEGNAAAALANSAAVVAMPAVTVRLGGASYLDNDVVTVTYSAGTLRAGSVGVTGATPTTISCPGQKEVGGLASNVAAAITLELTAIGANTITYTVKNRDPAVVIPGRTTGVTLTATTCTLPAVEMLASSLSSAATVTVNWSTTGDFLTDIQGNPGEAQIVHYARTQFGRYANGGSTSTRTIFSGSSYGVTGLAGYTWADTSGVAMGVRTSLATAAVAGQVAASSASTSTAYASRRGSGYSEQRTNTFTGTDNTNTVQTASVSRVTHSVQVTDRLAELSASVGGSGVGTGNQSNKLATVDNIVISFRGNFSFLDNNGDGCKADDLTSGYAQASFGGTLAAVALDCSEVQTTGTFIPGTTYSQSQAFSVGNNLINGSINGAKPLPVGAITATATLRAGTTVVATLSPVTVANWVRDSQTVQIPYMPYGSGISRIVYVTNNTTTSNVTISATNEAGTACSSANFPAVSAPAGRTTSIGASMDAGVAACYGASYTGKVVFNITLDVPSRDVYGIVMNEATLTGRTDVTSDYGLTSGNRTQTATLGAASVGTIAAHSGSLQRIAEPFEVYSAYNANGNRQVVLNASNGR